jgi:hypothetical protein
VLRQAAEQTSAAIASAEEKGVDVVESAATVQDDLREQVITTLVRLQRTFERTKRPELRGVNKVSKLLFQLLVAVAALICCLCCPCSRHSSATQFSKRMA